MTLVGLISDTHGLLRPQATAALSGVTHILHAGDVGRPEILDALRAIAPLTAVRGNVDYGTWAEALPSKTVVSIEGRDLLILHDVKDLELDAGAARPAAVVYGHTHKPLIETSDGVLYINPGSAGPRRFSLPISIGFLRLNGNAPMDAWLETLDV
jgi:uncharacterized protein